MPSFSFDLIPKPHPAIRLQPPESGLKLIKKKYEVIFTVDGEETLALQPDRSGVWNGQKWYAAYACIGSLSQHDIVRTVPRISPLGSLCKGSTVVIQVNEVHRSRLLGKKKEVKRVAVFPTMQAAKFIGSHELTADARDGAGSECNGIFCPSSHLT